MSGYVDAMGGALDRLRGVGYEHGPSFVNHAPMAAEALAFLGHADLVPGWLENNLAERRYHEPPGRRWSLSAEDEADWRPALGDFSRVADWSALFERELDGRPWPAVLGTWWPRLLPGMSGMLMHGVIRTAHAARSLDRAAGDDRLQRGELAQGLGYWAARYAATGPPGAAPHPAAENGQDGAARSRTAVAALDTLIADSAGHYATTAQRHPVPLIHTITGPAAVRLLCRYLPAEQHWPSYLAARRCNETLRSWFAPPAGPGPRTRRSPQAPDGGPAPQDAVAEAVQLGDEHAIKLAEVALRHHAFAADDRYIVASWLATSQLGRQPG